ncbi:hypothetical protein D9615_000883 [Tricholomella constricta]|uniref:Uncharacterized protein n=1 Tax=Tricholomella constricta TaxID=117010 RepID=A0A8H5HJR5_9AGAR|nr:hypothetical protein D9615_000883 [Tricholomella constricta]
MSTPGSAAHAKIEFYSQKAKDEGRNCFLWMTGKMGLVEMRVFWLIGWRVTDLEPMTIRNLYRYFDIAWHETCLVNYLEPDLIEVYLCQVRVEPLPQVLDYNVTPVGPVFSSESEELVTPGSLFGLCTSEDGSILVDHRRSYLKSNGNFDSFRAQFVRRNPFLETVSTMPLEIREAVLRRDHSTCCITGLLLTEAETAVEWIMPPALLCELEITSEERYEVWREVVGGLRDSARFDCLKVAGNAITMHRDLVEMYKRNQLSIDVDDKYHITCFNPPKDLSLTLQRSLTINNHSNDRLDDRYLRRHFSRCILLCMIGGGIHDDYKYHTVKSLVSEFGIIEASDIDKEDEDWPDDRNAQLIEAWMTQYGN